MRWALGEEKVFPARDIFWSVASADQCCMSDAAARMHPSRHTDPEVLDLQSSSPEVIDTYHVDLVGEDDWDLSHIQSSGDIDVSSRLLEDFTGFRHKCV